LVPQIEACDLVVSSKYGKLPGGSYRAAGLVDGNA
jgi:hypothetical protein